LLASAQGDDAARDRLENLSGLYQRQPVLGRNDCDRDVVACRNPAIPRIRCQVPDLPNVMAAGFTLYAVLGLIASYIGIYFYLRAIQYLFMSPEAPAGRRAPRIRWYWPRWCCA
jgi:NADH-quinone oxidoreductase subunit N